MQWNDQQIEIVNHRQGNLIVSASAGSGKTTVMLGRLLEILQEGVPLSRIVVLAFNKAIASEIKQKLSKELEKLIFLDETKNKEFLLEQLDDVDNANILTNDAYCNRATKEFFHILELEPNMSLLEEVDAGVLMSLACKQTIDNAKDTLGAEILELITKMGGEKVFSDEIINVYKYICVLPDGKEWIEKKAEIKVLDETVIFSENKKYLDARIDELLNYSSGIIQEVELLMPKRLVNFQIAIDFLNSCKAAENYSQLHMLFCGIDLPNLAVKTKDLDEQANERQKTIYSVIKKFIIEMKEFYVNAEAYAVEQIKFAETDARLTLDLIKDFSARYAKFKKSKGVMDYSDFTKKTVELLKSDNFSQELKDRYDYICVDEYQDTNYIQEFIINKISNGNNLFMVGDSKQSIYRFRLAEPSIMLEKSKMYEQKNTLGQSLYLSYNYRSDRYILEFVNQVFDVIMRKETAGLDYYKKDRLLAKSDYCAGGIPPVSIQFFVDKKKTKEKICFDEPYKLSQDNSNDTQSDTGVAEGRFIAETIKSFVGQKKIYDAEKKEMRLIRFSDIAIISRKRSTKVEMILKEIINANIPIDCAQLRKQEEPKELLAILQLLKCVDNDRQDYALAGSLLSFWGGLSLQEIYDIRLKHFDCSFFYQACLKERKSNAKLDKFYRLLEELREYSSFHSVYETAHRVVYYYEYDNFLRTLDDANGKLLILEKYLSQLANIDAGINVNEYLEGSNFFNIEIPKIGGSDCVCAMTIHASKGLEFPIVFLCDIDSNIKNAFNSNKKCRYHKEIGLWVESYDSEKLIKKPNFVYKTLKAIDEQEQREEAMRLFYVALTRAKNHLILTGSVSENESKNRVGVPAYRCNSFYDWLVCASQSNANIANLFKFSECQTEYFNNIENYAFRENNCKDFNVLENYLDYKYQYKNFEKISIKYSVSEINEQDRYEDELISYTYEKEDKDIFDVTKAKRGTNYHLILEKIDYNLKTYQEIKNYIKSLTELGYLAESEADEINIEEILGVLNSDIIKIASENLHYREQQFMLQASADKFLNTQCKDKILIQGAIDLIIITSNGAIVVDFKKSYKSPENLIQTYKKQLDIYAEATQEALGIKVIKKVLYIIGQNLTLAVD